MFLKPEKVTDPIPSFLQIKTCLSFFSIPILLLPMHLPLHTLTHSSLQNFAHKYCRLLDRQMMDGLVEFRFKAIPTTNIYSVLTVC